LIYRISWQFILALFSFPTHSSRSGILLASRTANNCAVGRLPQSPGTDSVGGAEPFWVFRSPAFASDTNFGSDFLRSW
jgi:hypothetical protein